MSAMMWAPLWEVVIQQLVMPLAIAAFGWLVTHLPGPLRTWMETAARNQQMTLLLGALGRAAITVTRPDADGRPGSLGAFAVDRMISYVETNLPGTVAKLNPSPEALRTIAEAVLVDTARRLGNRAEAVSPGLLPAPSGSYPDPSTFK